MAKKKQPARKGGPKKSAPKKAVKRKPIPQQVTEKAIKERTNKTDFPIEQLSAHPNVEEQFEAEARALPKSPAPKKRFRFRDAIRGVFVKLGWAQAHPDTTVRERVD